MAFIERIHGIKQQLDRNHLKSNGTRMLPDSLRSNLRGATGLPLHAVQREEEPGDRRGAEGVWEPKESQKGPKGSDMKRNHYPKGE